MTDDERSPAERALCTLAAHIADDSVPLIVLGGLVPEILTGGRETGPRHLGTTDVDMLLRRRERLAVAWRGRRPPGEARVPLRPRHRAGRNRRDSRLAGAACTNLRGTGHVAGDWTVRRISADVPGLGPTTVSIRFAGRRESHESGPRLL